MALQSPRLTKDPRLVAASNNAPPMRRNEQGISVARVQELLIEFGFPLPISTKGGGLDGKYGSETAGAVIQFQKLYGLKGVDGEVGRDTMATFDGILTGKIARRTPPGTVAPDPRDLALKCVPQARIWVENALTQLRWLNTMIGDPTKEKLVADPLRTAMTVHFHYDFGAEDWKKRAWLGVILDNYQKVQKALDSAPSFFQSATAGQCAVDRQKMTCDAPAYASFGEYARFSPDFSDPPYGPMCRSAMVLHECVHYVDRISPDKAYEWETAKYNALAARDAIHNPSSYASFGQNMTPPYKDQRYGMNRKSE